MLYVSGQATPQELLAVLRGDPLELGVQGARRLSGAQGLLGLTKEAKTVEKNI